MNILFFIPDDNTNEGTTGILRQIADYYIYKQCEVYTWFLASKRYGHWEKEKLPNLHLIYGGSLLDNYRNLLKLRKLEFDYSYTTIVMSTGLLGILKYFGLMRIHTMVGRESTLIFDRFSGLKLLYYKFWYYTGYRAVDILVCQTKIMESHIKQHLPRIEKFSKVIINPNPVSLASWEKRAAEPVDLKKYSPYIVAAGRFIPEKAYDILIEAFNAIIKDFPDLKLIILGDGELQTQVENQIEKLGLSQNVILTGKVDNVFPWFKAAVLCVISSRLEGFPNVLLQMMSQNERIVSTICAGGIKEIEGITTCERDNAIALSNAIKVCLTKDTYGIREMLNIELERRSIKNFVLKIEQTKVSNR